jgi:hypothetical protein
MLSIAAGGILSYIVYKLSLDHPELVESSKTILMELKQMGINLREFKGKDLNSEDDNIS